MVRPTLPVSFAPYNESTIVRVWTGVIGPRMSKISAPSRKNGRNSGKNNANRWFTSICSRSDSICEKSGLRVKSAVRFDVTPYSKLTPPSGDGAGRGLWAHAGHHSPAPRPRERSLGVHEMGVRRQNL